MWDKVDENRLLVAKCKVSIELKELRNLKERLHIWFYSLGGVNFISLKVQVCFRFQRFQNC